MGRRGEIGEAQRIAPKPAPRLGEMADISEMIAQILMARAHRLHVGRGALRAESPKHLLLDEIGGDLVVELAMEPVDQPPRLRPRPRIAGEQPETRRVSARPAGHHVAQIFGDRVGADDRAVLVGDEHGEGPRRIDLEELGAPFPGLLLDELDLDPALAEREPDRSGEGIEGVVQECRHRPVRWLDVGRK